MISLITFLGFVLAVALIYFGKRKASIGTLFLCFLSLVIFGTPLGTGPLIHSVQGDYLATHKVKWDKENLIMVLGMGTSEVSPNEFEPAPLSYGRIMQAAIAYKSCKQSGAMCKLIVSGGPTNHKGALEADVYASMMEKTGVPSTDMILERESVSTWENAKHCAEIAQSFPNAKPFLVTSGIHMRRALLYYEHFGVRPTPIRGDHIEAWPTIMPLAFNFSLADVVMSEYRGLARYRVYNAFGLNDKKAAPAARRIIDTKMVAHSDFQRRKVDLQRSAYAGRERHADRRLPGVPRLAQRRVRGS